MKNLMKAGMMLMLTVMVKLIKQSTMQHFRALMMKTTKKDMANAVFVVYK